jgi:SAM-dependent methyltransferase
VATEDEPFSILDYGCGYGALIDFLRQRYKQFDYTSFDISEEMIREARNIYLDLTVKRKCYILVGGITARLWAMGVYDSDEKVLNSISGQRRRVPIILCWFCEIFRRISKVVLYL